MKKITHFFLTIFLSLCFINPLPIYAQVPTTLIGNNIPAMGVLTFGSSELIVDFDGGGLTFNTSLVNGEEQVPGTQLGFVAPQTVAIKFATDNSTPGEIAIILSTNNKVIPLSNGALYTGPAPAAGLVNSTNTDYAAPLHWTIFEEHLEANIYDWQSANQVINPNIQPLVLDKSTPNFNSPTVLSMASVVSDIQGTQGFLPNYPYGQNQNQNGNLREVDGVAFLKFGVMYEVNGIQLPNGLYETQSLNLEMVAIS